MEAENEALATYSWSCKLTKSEMIDRSIDRYTAGSLKRNNKEHTNKYNVYDYFVT
jgi:hypothetical protein